MTKTIARKITWIGKATVFTVGLAVTLVLMFGVTTTALAAVPGDPFKLGQVNAVDAASTLVGRVNGAMLGIENKSQGSKGAPAPALSLKVAPNNPPLTANAEAGTATGLSADELDGKDSTQFLAMNGKAKAASNADFATFAGEAQNAQVAANADKLDGKDSAAFASGTNGKAVNSDLLDGKDSTAFVPTKTYTKNGNFVDNNGSFRTASATCDDGDVALSGGHTMGTLGVEVQIASERIVDNRYEMGFVANDSATANVTCADLPPLR